MTTPTHAGLNRYLLAQGIQFAAGGMLAVLFPWLITQELKESQINVGLAQTFANLPFLFLILLAGAIADGRDLKAYLPRLLVLMAMMPVLLALLVAAGALTLITATAVVFVLSALTAFATPARDAMLSHVVPHGPDLARASVQTVAATFGGQVIGTLVAALASDVGAVPLLCVQAMLMTFAAMLMSRVKTITPFVERPREGPLVGHLKGELMDGFRLVWQHERLRTLIIYLSISAPLFNGMFLVGIPLMVRDIFQGSSAMLSLLFTVFLMGMTLSSFALSRRRPVERPGRFIMLLFLTHIVVFTCVWLFPDRNVFTVLMFLWGLSSGASMSQSRGMIQTAAPPAFLGRVLSMQQFSMMAGAPVGALLFGAIAQTVGVLNAVLVIPVGVSLIWITFRLRTGLWHFRREDHPQA
ncbi:MAG: MFS transporter [Alphaproteobacteria bacterium]